MNLIDVARDLNTEEKCLAYLEAARWPGGVACIVCGSMRISRITTTSQGKTRKVRVLYDCLEKECGHQFSPTSNTLFHDTHLPLPKWFLALALFCDAKKSVSALQMQRHIGTTYKTAWYLLHRIRKAMEETHGSPFTGIVETDEMHIDGRYDARRKRGPWETKVIMGVLERGKDGKPSQVRTQAVKKVNKESLLPVIRENVSPDVQLLCTDQLTTYKALKGEFRHEIVNHRNEEWARTSVRGERIHTNSIENVWSLFNRALVGSFHAISIKHTHRYLSELDYKFNRRGANFFDETTQRLTQKNRLMYRVLVNRAKAASE